MAQRGKPGCPYERMFGMKRSPLILFALAAVALVIAALAWRALRPPLLPAVVLQAGPLERTLVFSARVASRSRVEVGATVTGRVERVAVREGDTVAAGDVLLTLESDELRATLAQAEASERQAAARLAGLRSTGRSAVQAGVAQAESVLRAAAADLQRTQDLVARGFLSAARLDEAQRALSVAQAQRDSAVAQAAANADGGTDIAQAQAQLTQAQAAAATARARLAQARIVAPSAARVLRRAVEPGQIVQPGRALLTLALDSPLELVGQVDERYLEQLQVGQAARVRADAFAQSPFAATVRQVSPLVDAQRGSVEIKLLPQEPAPAFLREDMTLSVEVGTGRRERALVLPVAALDGDRVRVLQDGRVQAREVRLGLVTLDAVEVTQGLAAGDVVLLDPTAEPGMRARADTSPGAAQRRAGGVSKDSASGAMSQAGGR